MPIISTPPYNIMTLTNVTAARAFNTNYTNNSNRTMFVRVLVSHEWINNNVRCTVETLINGAVTNNAGWQSTPMTDGLVASYQWNTIIFWVRPGDVYRLNSTVFGGAVNTLHSWYESA